MKKSLLFMSVLAATSVGAGAQELGEGYITWPESDELATYIRQWNGGNGILSVEGKTWEDQNFFVSRVKPRVRYYNTATQVNPGLTQHSDASFSGVDKRLCWWVPVGDEKRAGVKTNALPNGVFDQEAFSLWSYIDHYGNWNSPYGWVPGGFADAAHKNGVAVSGVASVAYGGISSNWTSCFRAMGGISTEEVGKFLYYHGVDGLGYNSEWSGYTPTDLINMHNGLKEYMSTRNPIWEVMWYAGTTDYGSINFDRGVGSGGGNTKLFAGASMFLNYNWNSTGTMSSSISYAKSVNRDPFLIYAGMNMQGGEPRSGSNYDLLKDYQYSIGLWGAHATNMLWQDRNTQGSTPEAMQRSYINLCETWFGNGPRNPAIRKTINTNRSHRPNADWAGMSSMMSARSAINWAIKDEPFYTYFNLGNGKFLNWKGERMNSNGWYNLGVQDYLPTWRWWFAPSFLQGNVEASDVHLSADFIWEDAYVGGSCLQIAGTSADEYLHLFKTNLAIANNNEIRISYKLVEGEADVELILVSNNEPSKINDKCRFSVMTAVDAEMEQDASFEGWVTKTFTINPQAYAALSTSKGNLGMVALHFKNAKNMKLHLGEFGIYKSATSQTATPAAPVITNARVLAYNYKGIDGKVIWNMANSKAAGEPVYNSDVNTSMFRMWSQQEGEEPVMMGMTTSWAGIVFSAPVNGDGAQNIRFGVSALSADLRSESEVAWSEMVPMGEYRINNDITINKSIIKPGEKFEMSYKDPGHAAGTWVLSDAQTGTEVWSGEGHTVECPGIENLGAYTLSLTCEGTTTEFPRYVSISDFGVGALPEIYTMSVDGKDADDVTGDVTIKINDSKTFSYTGRAADGSASRGVDLNEKWFGVNVGELGIQGSRSFSVAAWVKYNELPTGRSNFITIEQRDGGWPYNNWGFFWSRITEDGRFTDGSIDTSWGHRTGSGTEGMRLFYKYADAKIDVGAWTHVAITWEYQGSKMRQKFYINGKQQLITAWVSIMKSRAEDYFSRNENGVWTNIDHLFPLLTEGNYGSNTYEPGFAENSRPITSSDWITFGGMAKDITAVKGCVDDFQVWGKAMTQADVEASMAGLDGNNLPADVLGYWDLETDPASDYSFAGKTGSNATNKAPKAFFFDGEEIPGNEGGKRKVMLQPQFLTGCPYISGTAYPIVTKPTWEAARTLVSGDGNGEEGSATIQFPKKGDYAVKLTLANGHGEDTKTYPVIKVGEMGAIGEIATDGGFSTYTVDGTLFVEFDADGDYTIEVYNMSGMLVGRKDASILAGQNAQIGLGTAGVYVVKVVRDGKLLRSVKVISE